jgi:hypothetical protein
MCRETELCEADICKMVLFCRIGSDVLYCELLALYCLEDSIILCAHTLPISP